MTFVAAQPVTAVLIVAPPTLYRQGLLATLRDARPALPLTLSRNAAALPARLCRDAPSLLILDLALPGVICETLIGEIRGACPAVRLLLIGAKKLPFSAARLVVEHGGGALLARHATPGELVAAVAQLIGGPPNRRFGRFGGGGGAPRPCGTAPEAEKTAFTTRELEVLQLVAADYSSQEIATHLSISIRTVDCHRRLLLEKTGTRSIIGLVLHAVRHGWVSVV